MKKVMILILGIVVVLICGFFIYDNFFMLGSTYSRLKGGLTGTANVDIAIPITETSLQSFQVPLSDMEPGDVYEYTFSVTNKNSSNVITEVNMNYTIEVVRTTNIPLTIEIYKGDNNTNILTDFISPMYTLNHTNEQVDNYKIVVTWDITDNDYRYADLIELLDVNINAIQKVD